MPAIKTVDLCWSTPDDQSVISNLNLTFKIERAGVVGRNGVGRTGLSPFDGALLVVSHDEAFLAAIGISRRMALSTDLKRQ